MGKSPKRNPAEKLVVTYIYSQPNFLGRIDSLSTKLAGNGEAFADKTIVKLRPRKKASSLQ